MSKITNTSELEVETCEDTATVTSNAADLEIIEITLEKTVSCGYSVPGGIVTYCTKITNPSEDITLTEAVFSDVLDSRLSYVAHSFTVNDVPENPTVNGQKIEYTIPEIAPETVVTICLKAKVNKAV